MRLFGIAQGSSKMYTLFESVIYFSHFYRVEKVRRAIPSGRAKPPTHLSRGLPQSCKPLSRDSIRFLLSVFPCES